MPLMTRHQTALWQELAGTLDKHRPWFFAGDLNMVESLDDRKGGSGRILQGVEKHAWEKLCRRLNLEDTHAAKMGFLNYSWDSKRAHHHNPSV